MLYQYTSTQPIADQLKRLITGNTRTMKPALNAIQYFERADWIPRAFEDALAESPLHFDGEAFTLLPDSTITASQAVIQLLVHYETLIAQHPSDKFFTTAQAAVELGVSLDTMKKYSQRLPYLKGRMLGGSLVFTGAELDAFKRVYQGEETAVEATSLSRIIDEYRGIAPDEMIQRLEELL